MTATRLQSSALGRAIATLASVVALALLPLAGMPGGDAALFKLAAAQDHGSAGAGHASGTRDSANGSHGQSGHDAGSATSGGHTSDSGHGSGKRQGAGGTGHGARQGVAHGAGEGGEKARHGQRLEHQGHASGQHGGTARPSGQRLGGAAAELHIVTGFGGGPGLAGEEQVLEGLERHREGYAFGPQHHHRLRYWGGRDVPDGPGDDPGGDDGDAGDDGGVTPPNPGGGGGGTAVTIDSGLSAGARCDDLRAERLRDADYLSDRNLVRIEQAVGLLWPDPLQGRRRDNVLLLANYQQAFAAKDFDPVLAGSYLGLAAGRDIDLELAQRVNRTLCVTADPDALQDVVDAARTQRLALK